MRNAQIRECENGWVVELSAIDPFLGNPSLYVFTDWEEMMEFIAEHFAEEEEE